jgi:hypothetical protein
VLTKLQQFSRAIFEALDDGRTGRNMPDGEQEVAIRDVQQDAAG